MTNYNERLDEILTELCKKTQVDYGYEKLVPIATAEAKQSLTSLIKEVIGEDDKHRAWCGTSCDDTAHVTKALILDHVSNMFTDPKQVDMDYLAHLVDDITAESKLELLKKIRRTFPKKHTQMGLVTSRLTLRDIDRMINEIKEN